MMNIHEMPAYANEYNYIVVYKCDYYGEYWFYGAYNNKKVAERIASIVYNAVVLDNFKTNK